MEVDMSIITIVTEIPCIDACGRYVSHIALKHVYLDVFGRAHDTVQCQCCEEFYHPEDLTYTSDGLTCPTCFEAEYSQCSECDDWFPNDDLTLVNNREYCRDCFDRYITMCVVCENGFDSGDIVLIDGDPVCRSCRDEYYQRCDYCDELIHRDMSVSDSDSFLCEHCYENHFFTCEDCGQIYHNDYHIFHGSGGRCVDCDEYDDDYNNNANAGFHGAYYKPDPIFHGPGKDQSGMELETDSYSARGEAIRQLGSCRDDNFYLKADGSLTQGIEIVFHPRDTASWGRYAKQLQQICDTVRAHGGRSFNTSTCGIHIHRSRKCLTDIDLTKLICMTLRFKDYIITLAQRHSAYAKFSPLYNACDQQHKLIYKSLKDKKMERDRYVALNLQNEHTIEFRVFKGTLKVSTILAYIQFVDSFISWCKTESLTHLLQDDTEELWGRYVASIDKQFKQLKSYLEHHGIAA